LPCTIVQKNLERERISSAMTAFNCAVRENSVSS
jgi:hypothetical protein